MNDTTINPDRYCGNCRYQTECSDDEPCYSCFATRGERPNWEPKEEGEKKNESRK